MALPHELLGEVAAANRAARLVSLASPASPARAQASADPSSELAQHRRRLDVVTAIIGGWVWETDADHRFTYMSPSVERFAGKRPEWHYGKTRQELGNHSVQTADGDSWLDQLKARTSFGPVDFIRYQNGTALHMRTIGHPQFDADGTFTGYIGVAFQVQGQTEAEPAERRATVRRRVVRAAEIVLDDQAGSVSCVLVDISTKGARLRVPAEVILPDTFQIEVAALSLGSRCRLRWRRGGEIGVEFLT